MARSGATVCRLIWLVATVEGSAVHSISSRVAAVEVLSVLLKVAGRTVLPSTPGLR